MFYLIFAALVGAGFPRPPSMDGFDIGMGWKVGSGEIGSSTLPISILPENLKFVS